MGFKGLKGRGGVKEEEFGPMYGHAGLRLYVNSASCSRYSCWPGRGRHPLCRTRSPSTDNIQDKLRPRAKAQQLLGQARVTAAMLCVPGISSMEQKRYRRIQSPGFYTKPCPVSIIKRTLQSTVEPWFSNLIRSGKLFEKRFVRKPHHFFPLEIM